MFKFLGAVIVTFVVLLAIGIYAGKNETVLMVFSFAAPIVMFLYPRILCATEVYKMETDNAKDTGRLLCWVPIYNTYYIRKLQYFRAPVIGGILLFVLMQFAIITPVCRFVLASSSYSIVFNVIDSYLNILAIGLLWGVEAYVNIRLCKQVGYNAIILSIVVPPIATFFLAKRVNVFYRKNKHELQGTFKGVKNKPKKGR